MKSRPYRNAIRQASIRAEDDRQPNDAAEHIGNRPPRIRRVFAIDIGDDGRDECDEPSELDTGRAWVSRDIRCNSVEIVRIHTIEIETVASANGSPRILLGLNWAILRVGSEYGVGL